MIYFEFAICRDPEANGVDSDNATAEFMFDADSPGECTRRAAAILRARGWRAMSVLKAKEAFSPHDFGDDERVASLYRRAETGGIGFLLDSRQAEAPVEDLVAQEAV